MSKKWWWTAGAMTILFLFSGCASFKCLGGSCDKEIQELTISQENLKKEASRLDAENKEQEKTIAEDKEELEKLRNEKEALTVHIQDLQADLQKMRKEREQRGDEFKGDSLPEKQAAEEALGEFPSEQKEALRSVKVKVLAGDGRLSSARRMAKEIEALGFKVEKIDLAPRTTFSDNTVYYTPDTKNHAKKIAYSLGEDTQLKPMTWSSVYDIIAVSGEK